MFKLPNGQKHHHTFFGFSLTMIMTVILLYYSCLNIVKLYLRDDPDLKESIQHVYFSPDDIFSDKIGLKFAVGLTMYANEED